MKELVLLKLFLAWSRARATHIKCFAMQVPVLFVGEGCMLAADHQTNNKLSYPLINENPLITAN